MSKWGGVLFTRDNTKGFTLIELLAVIVILAVIALIATPIVLNIIEQARFGAAKSSAIGYVEASEKGVILYLMENKNNKVTGDCEAKSNVLTCGSLPLTLDVKGSLPTSGTITFDNNGNVNSVKDLTINGYKFSYDGTWAGEKDSGETTPPSGKSRVATKDDIEKFINYTPDNPTWDLERDGISNENETFDVTYYGVSQGESKNKSVSCYLTNKYNGWRIMNVSDSGQITLIHAGTPECLNCGRYSSGTCSQESSVESTSSNDNYTKAWTKYGNATLANSIHYMDSKDWETITTNYGSVWKSFNDCQSNGMGDCFNDKPLLDIGGSFWLVDKETYIKKSDSEIVTEVNDDLGPTHSGVRPVIVLKDNVKIKEDGKSGSSETDALNLVIE